MTGISTNNQGLQESVSYTAARSSHTTTTTKKNESGQSTTLTVSLSSSSYSWSATQYQPSTYESPSVYNQPLLPAKTNIDQLDPNAEGKEENNLVLAFIEQRLALDFADGASKEELQSRINAGYEGFMQGYNEAVSLLDSMGLFTGEVKDAVEQMFKKVIHGFSDLAEKYEIENPAADTTKEATEVTIPTVNAIVEDAPSPLQPLELLDNFVKDHTQNADLLTLQSLIEPSQSFYAKLDAETASAREYSFNLRTKDGDTVNIISYADQSARFQSEENNTSKSEQFSVSGMEEFSFSVQGELDSGELAAIGDLLSQLNDVAELFFEGDIYSAYQQALDVGYNSDEIAQFSLNLSQTDYTRIENTYGAIAKTNTGDSHAPQHEKYHPVPQFENKVARLSEFMRLLDKIRERGERFQFSPEKMAELTAFSAHKRHAHHPHFSQLMPVMNHLSKALSHGAHH